MLKKVLKKGLQTGIDLQKPAENALCLKKPAEKNPASVTGE
jgi:hypothetical protein